MVQWRSWVRGARTAPRAPVIAMDEHYEIRPFQAPVSASASDQTVLTWYKVYHVNHQGWAFPLQTCRTEAEAAAFIATAPPSPYARRVIGPDGLPLYCDRCRLPKGLCIGWRGAAVNVCTDCAADLRAEAESWGEPDEGRDRLDTVILPRLYHAATHRTPEDDKLPDGWCSIDIRDHRGMNVETRDRCTHCYETIDVTMYAIVHRETPS